MNTIERNKKNTRTFFDCFVKEDYAQLETFLAKDVVHIIPGHSPAGGELKGDEYIQAVKANFGGHVEHAELNVLNMTAEVNRVASEVLGIFIFKNGIRYENSYHFLYHFNDEGKITKMLEYMDTFYFLETFKSNK